MRPASCMYLAALVITFNDRPIFYLHKSYQVIRKLHIASVRFVLDSGLYPIVS